MEKDNTAKARKQEEDRNKMDQSVRVFDMRTNGGRQAFLSQVINTLHIPSIPYTLYLPQVLPDVPVPDVYWHEDDLRTIAAHQGLLAQMILDFEPFSMVVRRGFVMDKRMSMPEYKVHHPDYYTDLVDKVSNILYILYIMLQLTL